MRNKPIAAWHRYTIRISRQFTTKDVLNYTDEDSLMLC